MTARRGRHWTSKEDEQLRWWWGIISAEQLAKKLGRTRLGVIDRGQKLKLGAPRRGYLSMNELVRQTGYARSTILIAAQRLGLPLRRQPTYQQSSRGTPEHWRKKHKNYAIGLDVAERIIDELTARPDGKRKAISYRGEWGGPNKPERCLDCGKTDRPHAAKGACDRCYQRRKRKRDRRRNREA